MKKNEKSAKQREIEREKVKAELEAQFGEIEKECNESGISEKFFVEVNLERWEKHQPLNITGHYQDPEKIKSIYQQRFVEFTRRLCPNVIDELRALVPHFEKNFGANSDQYFSLFYWFETDFLDDANILLDRYLSSLLHETEKPLFPFLEFRPHRGNNFRNDYKWGEFRLLLNFIYLLFPSTEKETRNGILLDTLKLLKKNLVWMHKLRGFPKQFDEQTLQEFIKYESQRIFYEFLQNPENAFFGNNIKENLSQFLNKFQPDGEPDIGAFVLLKIKLLKWAERHNLEKDWLLRYAYSFLKQFKNQPNLTVSEIEVGYLQVRSLDAFPFEFRFDGWSAGGKKKEDYEKRLRESFESSLEKYFQSVGRHLNLDEKTKSTRPNDFDRVKWLVWWNFRLKTKHEILDAIYDERFKNGKDKSPDPDTIDKAFKEFKTYGLPVAN